MKRFICMILAILMLVSFVVSCNNKKHENEEVTDTIVTENTTAVLGDILAIVFEKRSDYVIVVDYYDTEARAFAVELSDLINSVTGVYLNLVNGSMDKTQYDHEIAVGSVRNYSANLMKTMSGDDFIFGTCGDDIAFCATNDTMYGYMALVVKDTLLSEAGEGYWNLTTESQWQYSVSELSSISFVEYYVKYCMNSDNGTVHTLAMKALKERLSGKYISFLGDSITTYAGYSNNITHNTTLASNPAYYPNNGTLNNVNQTYWMGAANDTGMTLLVNNSWSGDRVTGKGVQRGVQLHANAGANKGKDPDVIVVMLGVNDFNQGVAYDALKNTYKTMIKGMKQRYPNADIFMLTLVANTRVTDIAKFELYNEMIQEMAKEFGCTLVDAYHCGITFDNVNQYTSDGLHPNAAGMTLIKNCLIKAMLRKYL